MKTIYRLIIFILSACICAGVLFVMFYNNTSDKRLRDRYSSTVDPYVSECDMDRDGIDDQTDILNSAWEYLASHPKYKSAYYPSGYPDDGYGVCTDVAAFALKGAGYDLMQLVYEDRLAYPDEYADEPVDANIDFRRVRNLIIYFSHHAQSLSTDVHDISEWQGGDIVIFRDHIGIVSDRRNKNGVPYLIHHNNPLQQRYEEDVLEKRTDIVGHYRIS